MKVIRRGKYDMCTALSGKWDGQRITCLCGQMLICLMPGDMRTIENRVLLPRPIEPGGITWDSILLLMVTGAHVSTVWVAV